MQESDLWLVFIAVILVMGAFDFISNRKPHHIPLRSALAQTGVWVTIAVLFGLLLFHVTGDPDLTIEYYTAYIIEESMSMDNLFVFIIIFSFFAIPDEDQHKALFYGVVGAILFRAIFIFAGVELLQMFDWLLYVFGIILVIAALKTLFGNDDDEGDSKVALFMQKHFNYVDASECEGRLFIKRDGKRVATAILICIIVIEISDLIFAMDSIPAVLAISTDTLVIYTSNIFAVMGLRSLFFVIKGGMAHIRYLKYGLGAILLFVSLKLLTHSFFEIPILLSLLVIVAILAITIVASIIKNKSETTEGRASE